MGTISYSEIASWNCELNINSTDKKLAQKVKEVSQFINHHIKTVDVTPNKITLNLKFTTDLAGNDVFSTFNDLTKTNEVNISIDCFDSFGDIATTITGCELKEDVDWHIKFSNQGDAQLALIFTFQEVSLC